MTKINKIVDAIKKERYEIAESMLLELWRKKSHDAYINYLLGILYQDYRNPSHSAEKAKRHFRASIVGDKPIEQAFCELAWLERNKEHAKRILFRGLMFFPKSREINGMLLAISPNNEKVELFNEIVEKGIDSDSTRIIMIRHYFQSGAYSLTLNLIDKMQSQDKTDGMVLRLYKGLCFLENKEINLALAEFQQLINQDITNILEYAPNILSIVAISRSGSASADDVLKLFAQVPEDFQFIGPYVPWKLELCFDYITYILEAIKFLLSLTRKKGIIARARAIRALCVVGSEEYSYYSKTRAYKDLIIAHSVLPSVSKYTETLLELAGEKGDTFSAYKFSIEFLSLLSGKELEEKAGAISWIFISESTKDIFQRIIEDFERKLIEGELSGRVAVYLFTPVIERLHKEKDFSTIQKLVNLLGYPNIKDTNFLFEVAYALAQGKDNKRAAKYYELLLKKNGENTAALNNLALIHEELGDLQQAEQLLNKANNLNPDDAIVKRNLERIISLRKTAVGFMAMPYKNKKALLRLWELRDIEDKIAIRSDELPSLLALSDNEAVGVLGLLIKNKVILPSPGSENIGKIKKYILNPAVRCNIHEIEKEIEEKTPIMEIINDINNDGLSRIGFNKEIIDTLEKVFSVELRKSLRRDLQEAAFALMTRSYKTTQVMCGSIIEAVLLDKLSKQGKMKYICDDKKLRNINRMNLDDLLFVSLQEKLINEQLYHFAHALRGYRNLIHPGVEQRGQAMPISESNAKLAWDITRKLLKEI